MDVINYWHFKEAYTASKDVSKFLDQYEMSKLLRGPYDTEGACIIIKAEPKGIHPEASSVIVDLIPLFLETPIDLQVDDKDLLVSSLSPDEEHPPVSQTEKQTKPAVSIQHIPSGITAQSSGERSHFANKVKALNRLKAKLLVITRAQNVSNVKNINVDVEADMLYQDTRRYIVQPYKLVRDVKTRIQLPDLDSVLDGNIQALIGAKISIRKVNGKVTNPNISLCVKAIE